MTKRRPSLQYTDWYSAIKMADGSKDETRLLDVFVKAVQFFTEEEEAAQAVFRQGEKLVDIARNHMQYYNYYNNLHTQLEKLESYYEIKGKRLRGRILSDWDKNPPTNFSLSKADKSYLLEDHPEVVELMSYHDELDYLFKKYSKIVSSITNVGYMIGHLTRLRAAGQEEALL